MLNFRFLRKKLLFLLFICVKQINAQSYVLIPDTNFVIYLHALVPAAMHGDSLNTSHPLVTTTTHTINISQSTIRNIFGVQYFSSLTSLNCSNSPIVNLPTLPATLQSLVLYTDSLTSLPALPNSLTYLDCSYNYISNLPVLPNSITHLDCERNNLTSLQALPNSVTFLRCSYNHISSLSALPNSITYLGCSGNQLTSLPALPNTIKELFCDYNSLTTLPTLPDSLQLLTCEHNQLTSLPTLPKTLNTLFCQNNNIACFPTFPNTFQNPYFMQTGFGGSNGYWVYYFIISPNPYSCLPNYISAMGNDTVTYPLCSSGNSNGCAVATAIEQATSTNQQIIVYPNPASNQFFIETGMADKLITDLYDVNGRHVFSKSVSDKSNIDVTNLNEGIYTLTIKTTNWVIIKKLVIVR